MLEVEAHWVGEAIDRLDAGKLSPLLNLGSATLEFRQQVQPWIDRWIFAPLRERGVEVHHLDLQAGNGIDLRGDLTDEGFVSTLSEHRYRAVLCCNLLEHVIDPEAVCANIERLLFDCGYLIVTVPNRFPYHPDPIDTMFRPAPKDLVGLFPHCRLLDGALLECGTGWDYVEHNPWRLVTKVARRVSGLRQHGGLRGTTSFWPYLFRRFRQTCAVLEKTDSSSTPGNPRDGEELDPRLPGDLG
jgi:SAM-dependent methyltransferase